MGPRFRKRGNGARTRRTMRRKLYFNGAALSEARKPPEEFGEFERDFELQWGRAFGSAETGLTSTPAMPSSKTSMGPRFRKRGNVEQASAPSPTPKLQWGRAFGSAETATSPRWQAGANQTSMGPRFRKRGNVDDPGERRRCVYTSMGPRFRKRGNNQSDNHFNYFQLAFNGAALSEARKPTPETGEGIVKTMLLQWGRAFGSAETTKRRVER